MNRAGDSLALLLDRVTCRVVLAGRQTMRPGWSQRPRTLACHDIIRVEAGRGLFTSGDQRRTVKGPAWVILPAHQPHSIQGTGLRLAVVHVEVGLGGRLDGLKLFYPEQELSPALPEGAEDFFNRAIDAWREGTPVGRVCANRWMDLWFVRAFGGRRPTATVDPRMVGALAWLHENAGRPLRLDEVATEVGLSPAHLRSLFRRHFGASPKQILQEIRLTRAQALLAGGQVGVADAAYETGWEDVSAFSRSFRRRFGQTPGEFRRLATAQPIA